MVWGEGIALADAGSILPLGGAIGFAENNYSRENIGRSKPARG
jgi:hypothetical protein